MLADALTGPWELVKRPRPRVWSSGPLAQSVEHQPFKLRVPGSIPGRLIELSVPIV